MMQRLVIVSQARAWIDTRPASAISSARPVAPRLAAVPLYAAP